MNYCDKDWAVSDQLQDKVLVHYRRQEQAVVLRDDDDVSTAVKSYVDTHPDSGEHYVCRTMCDFVFGDIISVSYVSGFDGSLT